MISKRTKGLLASAILATAACETSEFAATRDQILGGVPVQVGDFPTVASVENLGLCTGTLIAPKVVVTAAHCVDPNELGLSSEAQVAGFTDVRFDSINAFTGGRRVAATKTVKNPGFNINNLGDNDIGLIFLGQAITDRDPSPVNITPRNFVGDRVTQVGFGISRLINGTADQNSAGKEFVLSNKLVSSCGDAATDNLLICYDQTDLSGKCNGDSGGPSFDDDGVVVGVTSFGDQDCVQFGADTNTAGEATFLKNTINANKNLACGADGFDFVLCDTDPDRDSGDGGKDRFRPGGPCAVSPVSTGSTESLFALFGSFGIGLALLRRRKS